MLRFREIVLALGRELRAKNLGDQSLVGVDMRKGGGWHHRGGRGGGNG